MKFNPKTEKQLVEENLLPDGVYDFRVMEAKDTQSRGGNDMIALKLEIYTDAGSRTVFDYLLEKMAFKLRHFCAAVGQMEAYESGTMRAENLVDLCGQCRLMQQPAKDSYPAKNAVRDYIVPKAKGGEHASEPATESAPASPDGGKDDIPF